MPKTESLQRVDQLYDMARALETWLAREVYAVRSRHRYTGQVAKDTVDLAATIVNLERRKIIEPGSKVIDLGSGYGTAAFMWSAAGYDVTGYEINDDAFLVAQGKRKQLAKEGLLHGDCAFANTSYFPPGYIKDRQRGRSKAIPLENRALMPEDVFYPEEGDISLPELRSFGVFYNYPWIVQVPGVMEVFSRYAKADATLVLSVSFQAAQQTADAFDLTLVATNAYSKRVRK